MGQVGLDVAPGAETQFLGSVADRALVERAFALVAAAQPIRDRMNIVRVRDIDQAVKQRTINADEAAQLKAAADAIAAAIAVNDFAPEELTSRGRVNKGEQSSQAISQPALQTSPVTPAPELAPPEPLLVLPPPEAAE